MKHRSVLWAVFLCLPFLLSGCSSAPIDLGYYKTGQESHKSFNVCHSFGCRTHTRVDLADKEWQEIKSPLKIVANTPEEERKHIGLAISKMEQIVGKAVGTDADIGRATAWEHGYYQLDCIDEAVNTSLYLKFLEQDGALKWHKVSDPARRGYFITGGWPHNTAVVAEKETGDQYVIDSWFFDNGQEPAIVPLQSWLDGWWPSNT